MKESLTAAGQSVVLEEIFECISLLCQLMEGEAEEEWHDDIDNTDIDKGNCSHTNSHLSVFLCARPFAPVIYDLIFRMTPNFMASSSSIEQGIYQILCLKTFFLKICTLKFATEFHRFGRNLCSCKQPQADFSTSFRVMKGLLSPEQGGFSICILKGDSIHMLYLPLMCQQIGSHFFLFLCLTPSST